MRNEILQLKDLGRMPNESINDTESIDELVNTYTLISTSTPLGNSNFIRASTVLAVEL